MLDTGSFPGWLEGVAFAMIALGGSVVAWLRYGSRGATEKSVEFLPWSDRIYRAARGEYTARARGQVAALTAADWPYAPGALYAAYYGYPCNAVPVEGPEGEGARMLARDWSVGNRADLLAVLYRLLTRGHRVPYTADCRFYADMSEVDYRRWVHTGPDPAELWRANAVRTNAGGMRHVHFLAWDLVRFVNVVCLGYRAGYLNRKEADSFVGLVAPPLQWAYAGWPDLWENFLLGRRFWFANRDDSEVTALFSHLATLAVRTPGGPCKVLKWDTPLADGDPAAFIAAYREVPRLDENGQPLSAEAVASAVLDVIRPPGSARV
ncbi:DUF1266 domain-containing protein [Phaeovibrio sulfidiphilus]|uniref:DUF1266 domain-containing protein n=1 Tax=Phaeovibrio sulfidiphilus TaxID=1220600 RepID=A0A8J7CDT7_9PROT|nr:DUF1266 domain-containing protein [Phaeovibrio sulfidiphilus]MBE1237264.1 DUF1266 domain-containing protein [Phaeovibrio sulfidiphilus]